MPTVGGITTLTGVKISAGDLFIVFGTMIDTTIESGGRQDILVGGVAKQTTIKQGGLQNDISGLVDHTTIDSGGTQNVSALADHTTIHGGGTQDVGRGGTANNTTIRGGSEIVENGGTAGNTTLHGGLLDLKDGALTSASITFEPGKKGTLQIAQPVTSNLTFKAPLINISEGDKIDLTGLTFTKATTATVTGSTLLGFSTLLVDDHAGHTESFNLITPKITHFEVSMDNGTGTMLIGIHAHDGHSHV